MCLDDAKTWTPHLRTSFTSFQSSIQTEKRVDSGRPRRPLATYCRLVRQQKFIIGKQQDLLSGGGEQRLPGATSLSSTHRGLLRPSQGCSPSPLLLPSASSLLLPSSSVLLLPVGRPPGLPLSHSGSSSSSQADHSSLVYHLNRRRGQCLRRTLCLSRKLLPLLPSGYVHSWHSDGHLASNSREYSERSEERGRPDGACLHRRTHSDGVHSAAVCAVLCEEEREEETADEEGGSPWPRNRRRRRWRGSDSTTATWPSTASSLSCQLRSHAPIACASENCRNTSCQRPQWNTMVAA